MTDAVTLPPRASRTSAGSDRTPSRPRAESQPLDALTALDAAAKSRIRILVVDDEHEIRESCASILRLDGYDVTVAGRGKEATDLLARRRFHIVLVDLHLPQVDGFGVLQAALAASADTIVIMMTGKPSVESSVDALRHGAWDYLPKPFSATQLQILVGRAAHTVVVTQETQSAASATRATARHTEGGFLGESVAFRNIIELARKVAATDASVFITGESGSGKEMIARFIHENSRRASRPFVALNCAALPETLLESEMFGHRKGAFTDAVRDKPGLMETANGGTLFMDELLEMSRPIQAKLLRVLQDGVVRRVGSESTDAVINVRFLAATNRSPEQAIREGTLREDLYYRLCVVPITVPPLRERRDDIPLLAEHFLATYWARHRSGTGDAPHFTPEAVRVMQDYAWPGNVRELQNVIEHTVVLIEPNSDIRPQDLSLAEEQRPAAASGMRQVQSFHPGIVDEGYHAARDRVIGEFEIQYLTWLVERAGGNMSKAARIAGVDRTTLYRLMERHGLHRSPTATWVVERHAGDGNASHPAPRAPVPSGANSFGGDG
jgi:DNA-binding NtrC family response regulator